jgi:hypothetical protein
MEVKNMEFTPGWQHAVQGAIGGLIGILCKGEGILRIPAIRRDEDGWYIKGGFLAPIAIGAFAGYVIDRNPALAGLAGFAGKQLLDFALAKAFPELKETDDGSAEG